MHLATLMELLEREIGASPSARSKLAALVAERGQKEGAPKTRAHTTKPRPDASRRDRNAGRPR